MSARDRPILQLDGISKRYTRQGPAAVEAVDLTLERGDILGLLGPSGCGKTTLLRLIAGFERPQSGQIAIAGRAVASAATGAWVPPEGRDVGMVFQDYALFPHLSVAGNIAFGLRQRSRRDSEQRAREVLALVGMDDLEARYPHELSGGQQQRVALARALAPQPALVLLDEPLSNLDVQVRLRLRQELRDILKAAGASAVFVTHDREEALSIADRVAVMRAGQLEQVGTPEDTYNRPATRFVAEFVAQANLLPARSRGDRWESELGSFARAGSAAAWAHLAVRPEHLQVTPDPSGTAVVRDRQFLGCDCRYLLRFDTGSEVIARLPARAELTAGTRVRVAAAPECVQVFAGEVPPATPVAAARDLSELPG